MKWKKADSLISYGVRNNMMLRRIFRLILFYQVLAPPGLFAAEKMIGIHSARVMSQSYPWIAEEAGLFKKYNIDFQLVFIASSGIVTAALLGGDADMTLTGGVGNVRAYVQGSTDVVFIGGVKNTMVLRPALRPIPKASRSSPICLRARNIP